MKHFFNEEQARLAALRDIEQECGTEARKRVERDTIFDQKRFNREVNHWTMRKMLKGIDTQCESKKGCAPAA